MNRQLIQQYEKEEFNTRSMFGKISIIGIIIIGELYQYYRQNIFSTFLIKFDPLFHFEIFLECLLGDVPIEECANLGIC